MNYESFWGENYYNHPELTEEMIDKAEARLGVKLPPELLNLLKIQNGGYTNEFVFPTDQENSWADDHIPLNALFGIVVDESLETAQNILDSECMIEEWDLPPKQVLLSGEGHWWISLDYRNGEVPVVSWIDVEGDECFEISPSLGDFLRNLIPVEEFEAV